jgi:hypothetical protein
MNNNWKKKKPKVIDMSKIKTTSIGHPGGTYIPNVIKGFKIVVREKYNIRKLIFYIFISTIPIVLGIIFSFQEIILAIISFIFLIVLIFIYPPLKDTEYDGTGSEL